MGLFGLFRRKIVVSEEELLFWEGLRAYQAKDYTRALPIFEQAATKEHPEAQLYCGKIYRTVKINGKIDYQRAFFYPLSARRLRPLRWEMNCVYCLLARAPEL